jgi:hypothetical protein
MPLLSPLSPASVKEVLKEAKTISKSANLEELLEANGLGPEEVLQNLGSLTRCAEVEGNRLRAIEMGIKLNGMLRDDEGLKVPIVNIIINDSEYVGVNPILIPRSL